MRGCIAFSPSDIDKQRFTALGEGFAPIMPSKRVRSLARVVYVILLESGGIVSFQQVRGICDEFGFFFRGDIVEEAIQFFNCLFLLRSSCDYFYLYLRGSTVKRSIIVKYCLLLERLFKISYLLVFIFNHYRLDAKNRALLTEKQFALLLLCCLHL